MIVTRNQEEQRSIQVKGQTNILELIVETLVDELCFISSFAGGKAQRKSICKQNIDLIKQYQKRLKNKQKRDIANDITQTRQVAIIANIFLTLGTSNKVIKQDTTATFGGLIFAGLDIGLVLIFLARMCVCAGYNVLFVYVLEYYPTAIQRQELKMCGQVILQKVLQIH